MQSLNENFTHSIKRKIIIAFILACAALFFAWAASKIVFREMLDTVENISTPSERLRFVNKLSLKVIRLDQQQKSKTLNDPKNYQAAVKSTKQLALSLDTLSNLYAKDSLQLMRVRAIKNLLKERDRLFLNYLQVREGFLNNDIFSDQVKSLNDMVLENSRKTDSTILESEKRTLTTTIYNLEEPSKEKEQKGFLNKLFGGKKEDKPKKGVNIVNEELNVKYDTVELAKQDSLLKDLGETMRNIEQSQKAKSKKFLNREALLNTTGDLLINKMLTILRKVEAEAVKEIEQTNNDAKKVVNNGIKQIGLILLVFLVVTIVLLYFILTDISKNNRYRKALEQAKEEAEFHNKAKQRFLSNMSHEIRTPLQSIIGYADLIKDEEIPNRKNINAIAQSSEHLMQIVNEILDYNRIISGKFTFSSDVFNLEEVLNEVIAVMKLQAEKKELKLFFDFDLEENIWVEGDAFRLKQVIYNLLGNAIKFTNKGYVALNVSSKKQRNFLHCMFNVEDTGIGMTAKELNLVFNEFEQGDIAQKQINQQGAGLGLSISKSLVESQGGRISAKSKKGEGTAFTFYLQFTAVEAPLSETKKGNQNIFDFTQKVWIVDDDPFILDLCAAIFEQNHISYKCFASAKEMLNTPFDHNVKHILTDMRMPEINGTTLCKVLKSKLPDDVKITALTAQVLPEEREEILKSGFDGLLLKPFRAQQLLGLLQDDKTKNHLESEGSYIEKMTFGDTEQLFKMKSRFKKDNLNDVGEIDRAIEENDVEKTALIIHRLAGRIAQFGENKLAEKFRQQELLLNKVLHLDENKKEELKTLLNELKRMMIGN